MNQIQKIDELQKQKKYLKVCTICWWVGFPLSVILIGLPVLIIGIIYFYMLLYRAWDRMQTRGVSITPGKSIGFCFIPFFNFYWHFEAFCTLAKCMNNSMKAEGINCPPISFGRCVAFSILSITMAIPYVNLVALIPVVIIGYLVIRDISLATEAMIVKDADSVLISKTA